MKISHPNKNVFKPVGRLVLHSTPISWLLCGFSQNGPMLMSSNSVGSGYGVNGLIGLQIANRLSPINGNKLNCPSSVGEFSVDISLEPGNLSLTL